MTPVGVPGALAIERIRDLERAASRNRLAGQARVSGHGTLRRAVSTLRTIPTAVADWIRRGQLAATTNHCSTC